MTQDATPRPDLKRCPFCGAFAESQPRHGGAPTRIAISCMDQNSTCDAGPMVTGETPAEAEERWNTRANIAKTDAEIVAEVNNLARTMLGIMGTGYTAPAGFKFYADHEGHRPAIRAVRAWNAAVTVYEQITGTEVSDALQAFMESEGQVEIEAERHYEAGRQGVAGRPVWGQLNPADPYDMAMRDAAMKRAREQIAQKADAA